MHMVSSEKKWYLLRWPLLSVLIIGKASQGASKTKKFRFRAKASPFHAAQLPLVNSQLEIREEGLELPLEVNVGNKYVSRQREGKRFSGKNRRLVGLGQIGKTLGHQSEKSL